MFKSKLQQLCQQKLWSLPKYSCLRDGPDHCPAFKASVLVNGRSFESVSAFNSSKAAQNDAAMRAFFQLESDSSSQSDTELVDDKPVKSEEMNTVEDPSLEVLDMEFLYKLQLQTCALKNHLSLPSYAVTRIGPPSSCHFMACVTVGEQEFKTVTFSKSAKEAENAAAKIALTCLSPDGPEQIFPGHVKNLLQELAQKEGLSLPKYKISHSGPAHMQLFYSTVEVGGISFQGKAAKSKKVSEVYAAEVAYRSLEQRKLDRTTLLKPVSSPEAKSLNAKDLEKAIQKLSVDIKKSALEASESAQIIKEKLIKYESEPNQIGKLYTNGQPIVHGITETEESESKTYVSADSLRTPVEFILSAAEYGGSNHTTCQSYLLNNRVRVYTTIPDIEFPKGVILIPIADNKWVPVSLEFPNEKGI